MNMNNRQKLHVCRVLVVRIICALDPSVDPRVFRHVLDISIGLRCVLLLLKWRKKGGTVNLTRSPVSSVQEGSGVGRKKDRMQIEEKAIHTRTRTYTHRHINGLLDVYDLENTRGLAEQCTVCVILVKIFRNIYS